MARSPLWLVPTLTCQDLTQWKEGRKGEVTENPSLLVGPCDACHPTHSGDSFLSVWSVPSLCSPARKGMCAYPPALLTEVRKGIGLLLPINNPVSSLETQRFPITLTRGSTLKRSVRRGESHRAREASESGNSPLLYPALPSLRIHDARS